MIMSVRVNNFYVYSGDVELSLVPDMRIKKFADNVYRHENFNVVKSACIYGANNSGKTCLLRAISTIKTLLLGQSASINCNIFTGSNVVSLGISFLHNGEAYSYDVKYDFTKNNNFVRGFIYECLKEISIDKYGNTLEKEIYVRDVNSGIYRFINDPELSKVLGMISSGFIVIYSINSEKYPAIEKYRNILRQFAESIDIVDMNNIPIEKTILALKNNNKIRKNVTELVKLADLDIEDFLYLSDNDIFAHTSGDKDDKDMSPQEIVLRTTVMQDDIYRLTSVHRGKRVQSLSFDSTGTKKIIALASYIVEALMNGKTLVVDELDSSIHFKLTRSIVALFNNQLNSCGQLIFTAHDVTLLDCKKLFRKDQIWFASKDKESEYLYSLSDFSAQNDGVRSESDLIEKYNSGQFGAIPNPDFISAFLSFRGDD